MPVYAYNFMTNHIHGDSELNLSYWRDVGTLDAYYEANMDLRDARPHLNLYNPYWPLRTAYYNQPPAKFVFNEDGRRGEALHSVISEGCIISGGVVRNSVLGRSVFVHSYSQVDDSVLMDYCEVGRHARIRRAIIDKNVNIPEGEEIGYDLERDRKRFFVTESGLVVIPKAPKRERKSLAAKSQERSDETSSAARRPTSTARRQRRRRARRRPAPGLAGRQLQSRTSAAAGLKLSRKDSLCTS